MKLESFAIFFMLLILLFILYSYKLTPIRENFGETLGMLEPQRKYYTKCVSECSKNSEKSFKSTYSPMQLLCHQNCAKKAESRVKNKVSDIKNDYDYNCDGHFDKDLCTCEHDVSKWCKNNFCIHSKIKDCQDNCVSINLYKCRSGLSWSGKI